MIKYFSIIVSICILGVAGYFTDNHVNEYLFISDKSSTRDNYIYSIINSSILIQPKILKIYTSKGGVVFIAQQNISYADCKDGRLLLQTDGIVSFYKIQNGSVEKILFTEINIEIQPLFTREVLQSVMEINQNCTK